MGASEEKHDELEAFEPAPLENLTVQDALIFSAVYSAQADSEKCEKIRALAEKHPLFDEKPEDTLARVNKFTNWMQAGQDPTINEALSLLGKLKPEQRKQAFEFAIQAALMDSKLTEEKEKILRALAVKLNLDDDFINRQLANV